MKDTTIQPLNIDLAIPSDEQIDEGANALQVNLTIGIVIPLTTGPGQPPIVVPTEVVRIPMVREQALSLGEKLLAEAERLPRQSSIVTANSLSEVDKVAEFAQGLRSDPS